MSITAAAQTRSETRTADGGHADGGPSRLKPTINAFAASGSSRAARLDFRSGEARREADIKRLGDALDRLSDRRPAVPSLSRELFHSQIEDRCDAFEERSAAASSLTDAQHGAETPKSAADGG